MHGAAAWPALENHYSNFASHDLPYDPRASPLIPSSAFFSLYCRRDAAKDAAKARRSLARALSKHGFPFEECIKALAECNDDINKAAVELVVKFGNVVDAQGERASTRPSLPKFLFARQEQSQDFAHSHTRAARPTRLFSARSFCRRGSSTPSRIARRRGCTSILHQGG